jgi:hypothetical protein
VVLKDFPTISPADLRPGAAKQITPAEALKRVPNFVVILTTRDSALTLATFKKLAQQSGLRANMKQHADKDVYRLSGGKLPFDMYFSIADDLVFCGNNLEQVQTGIDLAQTGGGALAMSDAYRHVVATATAPQKRFAAWYMNMPAYLKAFPANATMAIPQMDPYGKYKQMLAYGGTLTVTPATRPGGADALRFEAYTWGERQIDDPIYKKMLTLPSVGGNSFHFLPKGALGAVAIQSPATFWKFVNQMMSATMQQVSGLSWGDLKAQMRSSTGFDIDQDLFGWMTGELALGVTPSGKKASPGQGFAMPVNITLAVEGADAATVKAKQARLRNLLLKSMSGSGAAWNKQVTGTTSYYTLGGPMPFTLCAGEVSKYALVTSATAAYKQALAASAKLENSLAGEAAFTRLKSQLPPRLNSFFFVSPSRINAAFPGMDPAGLLGSIGVIGIGDSMRPDGEYAVGYMEIFLPRFINALDNIPANMPTRPVMRPE